MAGFDVVITTLDILKAKEVVLPIDCRDDADASDNCDETTLSSPWLKPRKADVGEGGMKEYSYLHLINWHTIIADISAQSNIRPSNVRGKALSQLRCRRMVGLVEEHPRQKESLFGLKSCLACGDSVPASAITFTL